MFLLNDRVVISASDLGALAHCEFATLRRFDERLGRDVVVPPETDPIMLRAAQVGIAYEASVQNRLAENATLVEIPRVTKLTEAELGNAEALTVKALEQADVVAQATFFETPLVHEATGAAEATRFTSPEFAFVGYADFLQRQEDGVFKVLDAKLTRVARPTALMQLAAYYEQLRRLEVPVSETVGLILGDGVVHDFPVGEILPVFRAHRARLIRLLSESYDRLGDDGARASAAPVRWGADGVLACGTCEVCAPEVREHRDLVQVYGMRPPVREALRESGIHTIDALAQFEKTSLKDLPEVRGITPAGLGLLGAQAAVQIQSEETGLPHVSGRDAQILRRLPFATAGDIFLFACEDLFHAETNELTGATDHGLVYALGGSDGRGERFCEWATAQAEESTALTRLLNRIDDHRAQYPDAHVYHFGPGVVRTLTRIAADNEALERAVDGLIQSHRLIDLRAVLRDALHVGVVDNTLNALVTLTGLDMGEGSSEAEARLSDLLRAERFATNDLAARESIGGEVGDMGERLRRIRSWLLWVAAATLARPLDALSTAEVKRWEGAFRETLRGELRRYLPEQCLPEAPEKSALGEQGLPDGAAALLPHSGAQIRDGGPELAQDLASTGGHALLRRAAERGEDTPLGKALQLASAAVDYYRRERRSFELEKEARLTNPLEDWVNDRNVFRVNPAASHCEQDRPRVLRLVGELSAGSKLRVGDQVLSLYAIPEHIRANVWRAQRIAVAAKIVAAADREVVVRETGVPDWVHQSGVFPIAITPGAPPPAGAQQPAIESFGESLARLFQNPEQSSDRVRNAAFDVLMRQGPCLDGGETLAQMRERLSGGSIADLVTEATRALRFSALAVQGPPGSGKTTLGSQVIRRLVEEESWHIGVVGQSHAVVENLLAAVVRAGLPPEQVGKVPSSGMDAAAKARVPYTNIQPKRHTQFHSDLHLAGQGAVSGGTAWDLANTQKYPNKALDLLVVDEAGQFSLAALIAASQAAKRILLLGDPRQLPEVSSGVHPYPVNQSALNWLLGGEPVIPDHMGVFLPESFRMHPDLCEVVSHLAYAGKLTAASHSKRPVLRGAGMPGVVWHAVEHHARTTFAPEEATKVSELVRGFLSGSVSNERTGEHLTQDDIIVVAPYNAQVLTVQDALSQAGFPDVRVGTVDRFQGQEAKISILTLAASRLTDIPRGVEFLLMPNRLNVAVSRAQWACHIVSSPGLAEGIPHTADGLRGLSAYLTLLEYAHTPEPVDPSQRD